jgi:hypothetical protein
MRRVKADLLKISAIVQLMNTKLKDHQFLLEEEGEEEEEEED